MEKVMYFIKKLVPVCIINFIIKGEGMNMLKKILIPSLTILIISFVSSSAIAGKLDNTIVFAQSTAVTDLGPAYGAFLMHPGGYEASFVIYDRLVTFDDNLNINPQLATSWEVSDDQKVITFKLRKGVKFHDGSPFNAKAVKFNIVRMMNEKINTTNRPLWDPIAGSDVIDDYTVTIRTKEPFAILLNTVSGLGIPSPIIFKKYAAK